MPEPTVPPTPPVTLSALLAREDLALRQIAGPTDADTVIHWAHTSEMADPYPYLLGGELLLTAGVHIPEAAGSGTYFDDYVSRIVAAGGAALGFGLAPVHDTVPRALVAACDAYGLPLVEVPPRTTFSGVARAVWQLMAQARHAELRRVTEAQQSLAAAASRPDPVRAVLRQLAQRVGGWAVLYGSEGAVVAAAGRGPQEAVTGSLAELAEVVRPSGPGTPASATDTASGTHLAAYALGAEQGFVLGVAAPHRDPGDHTIASVAAVLLSLLTGEHQSGSGTARSSALVRLLLGAEPQAVAPLLGADRWLVVHGRPDTQPCDPVAASALGAALGSPLVDLARDVVRVLVPADREPSPLPGWTLGVSAPATAQDWPAADTQAARALSRARATRTPLFRHGTHRPALVDLLSPDEAQAHARTLLAPLTTPLTETLRTWLSLHGSWDRTAVALSVHRNTVRQRIARCAALLGTDLDDPDVRMELWFALRHIER
ncbi:PucR family transcriptional regulator ligand-binding domain-containing protein [Streptomyces sp. DT2A-34]|uniref:helix-turn-helix domain-containing protein n=1 Tax=Streptomyces sp. DT2A-34 TaxID=3051182 RepID=UPI00265B76F6|nr:PucR family transcriptional regulator [Streptomyces sp. DT2A-34]MDO0914766.1 PucR family transcriptional regulator ligand-binding domain-containing protein [Streptomyces sp. DT2A-34]